MGSLRPRRQRSGEPWDAAGSRGLTLLPVLAYTPVWACPAGCSSDKRAPADTQLFADFAAAATHRYASGGVVAWETWNEPNTAGFWEPDVDPAAYADLLKKASTAPTDIFEGLIVHTLPLPGRHLFADADQIASLHERGVLLSVDRDELHDPSQKSTRQTNPDNPSPGESPLQARLRRAWDWISGQL
jgi:hypothetical protein